MKKLLWLILVCNMFCFAGCGVSDTAEKGKQPAGSVTQSADSDSDNTQSVKQEYIEVVREGISDRIPVTTVNGRVGNYTIAIDPEYFTLQSVETADIFSYDGWNGVMKVYFSISNYYGTDRQEFVDSTVGQFKNEYESYTVNDIKVGQYDAVMVNFHNCKQNRDYQKDVIMVVCGDERYLFEAQYTLEMSEGLRVIMSAMFDTFKVN